MPMHDWESVREKHVVPGKTYQGSQEKFHGSRILWAGAFGYQFEVLDTKNFEATERGPYDGPCASVFYEPEPVFLEHWGKIKHDDVVLDIGANIGSYAIPAAIMGAKVISFEPTDSMHLLVANMEINGFNYRISRDIVGHGGLAAKSLSKTMGFFGEAKTTAIDNIYFFDDRIDWIKIDVEGMELDVIQGAAQTIQKHKPTLVIEDHDSIDPGKNNPVSDYPASIQSSWNILKLLGEWGYDFQLTKYDMTRKYIVARHPSRGSING